MDVQSPVQVLLILAAATLAGWVRIRLGHAAPPSGRFASLDGLRGYLALCVFAHHACIWYFYLHGGTWLHPTANFYSNLGSTGVALFFMVTGFLFYTKLLDSAGKELDWGRLFVSRVTRIVPLYAFTMLALFAIVFWLSKGQLREPLTELSQNVLTWVAFTTRGMPNINEVPGTFLIVAGVTWSLPYEWLFYFALPLLGLVTHTRASRAYLAFSVIATATMLLLILRPPQIVTFLGGILAAHAVRDERFRKLAGTHWASCVVLACLTANLFLFPKSNGPIQLALLTTAFALMAGGASLFGLLVTPAARVLGEVSYSIYLLHGLVLFIAFKFVLDRSVLTALSAQGYWLVVVALTPLLVAACCVTFATIEHPAMQSTTQVTGWLRRLLGAWRLQLQR
ncbi:acyltransferase family protein [Uliginosibacterium sp. H1]|uniref:acyltransferase family protein n=1 Tax=Uliginosibacterium sp. H1 TaxID=3114757 RepID=UPI002E189232|nr:acyltransferase [Uliginosibacterium sp. H1]